MKQKLRILFVPIDATGHVNSAIGMAQVLMAAGHEITFGISDQWTGKLEPYGIREIVWTLKGREDAGNNAAKYYAQDLKRKGILGPDGTPLDKAVIMFKDNGNEMFEACRDVDEHLAKAIDTIQPDIIVCDQIISLTSITRSGIPWVLVCSCNPLTIMHDNRTPPPFSGLPTTGPYSEWQSYREAYIEGIHNTWKQINDYELATGLPPLPAMSLINESKYLNIYGYPEELDYLDIRPLPENWYRFDNLMRKEKHRPFELPKQLSTKPGKLIFFSLGSMGAVDVENMKRLVNILGKSRNRFIVSKGPLGDEYDLPDNMWGQSSVPQIQVLPLVDLVINHGGNNTLNETIYFGKPMIVMPLFADQYDNAQRVHEKGFGIRLDAYKCSEKILLSAIDKLLNDNELREKMQKISQRIQSDNNIIMGSVARRPPFRRKMSSDLC
ncbi:uncharacterized UDP-glucosyltransferase YojK-like [Oppia nitens]|uniref:uncharacterized UDP-glucosyltransferase YojK-like n=1 Tax=Oppia nitens TaxID=1686743 RepID=UPI0023DBFBB1|nr:uncharacterized UDP-glucosyltransferase YojK-like [Oppia nitens]